MKLVPSQERAAMLLFEFGGKIPGASVASLKQTSPSLPAHLLLQINAGMYLGKRDGPAWNSRGTFSRASLSQG